MPVRKRAGNGANASADTTMGRTCGEERAKNQSGWEC